MNSPSETNLNSCALNLHSLLNLMKATLFNSELYQTPNFCPGELNDVYISLDFRYNFEDSVYLQLCRTIGDAIFGIATWLRCFRMKVYQDNQSGNFSKMHVLEIGHGRICQLLSITKKC